MHVTLDQYLLTLRGVLPWELLLQQAHRHLLDLCPECYGEWNGEWNGGSGFGVPADGSASAPALSTAPRLPADSRHVSLAHVQAAQRHLSRMRAVARRAREDLARLRRAPRERWPAMVRNARTRFRSRAFAHLLLETAQEVVRTAPREAAALAALVPVALAREPARRDQGWARELDLRAAAHHANALRVAGDLPGADHAFAEVRRQLRRTPVDAPGLAAEISSLEASLRIGQRRFADADRLLTAASAATGESPLAHRILIKHANLLRTMGRAEEALERFALVERTLDAAHQPQLALVAVTGRINCLCDLDRCEAAGRLLAGEPRAYVAASGDDYATVLFAALEARVHLGLGRLEAAERGFLEARDRLLALDRDYDAILASLFLADALLAAGKMPELRKLAADLVPLFQARGVERETLASLRLLAQAVKAETVTAALAIRAAAEPAGRLASYDCAGHRVAFGRALSARGWPTAEARVRRKRCQGEGGWPDIRVACRHPKPTLIHGDSECPAFRGWSPSARLSVRSWATVRAGAVGAKA